MTRPTNAELRELIKAATPGPWEKDSTTVYYDGSGEGHIGISSHTDSGEQTVCVTLGEYTNDTDNAALIVAAVNSLAELVEENEAMRETLEDIATQGLCIDDEEQTQEEAERSWAEGATKQELADVIVNMAMKAKARALVEGRR